MTNILGVWSEKGHPRRFGVSRILSECSSCTSRRGDCWEGSETETPRDRLHFLWRKEHFPSGRCPEPRRKDTLIRPQLTAMATRIIAYGGAGNRLRGRRLNA
ncbi:hypothetical protein SKAU_G00389460 [Synaphobranchus kaupii]|uniref:Uncharacterized protein n=1 Tax=Synaphobranchus kaupii TaxID=118154 RepID=A0A9Q1EB81_SYNKA|nr:hypothetical protein SKAU_G00389460 [Synaphobranchus kaupii]